MDFEKTLKDTYKVYLEQDVAEEEPPPVDDLPEPDAGAEGEEPASDMEAEAEDGIDDDTSKLVMDMINLARKALTINPDLISRQDWAMLTQEAEGTNAESAMELVERIVEELYPRLDL